MNCFYRILLVPLTFALAFGCASSGGATKTYDKSDNETIYRSGTIGVGQISSGRYGGNTPLTVRVVSECSGRSCTPNVVRLTFAVDGETSDVGLSGRRTFSVSTDESEYEYEQVTMYDGRIQKSEGRLLTVEVPISDLEQIATATSINGTIGGLSLNLRRAQSDLQRFLFAIRNPKERP
ncbi:hypothetical protein GGP86_000045 [Salinibacter ruber]|uniref:hypothetical protein n=1 Tax=Salinibacter ruber TaxID=146919 RepID=UPI002166CC5E|nr:hypothetical protein [Salinibacter ruber]MCS3860297.1 hypothetical protein [Salinibacter ruber]